MHILIAPNAFKNSLSAVDAALAIQTGLRQSNLLHTSQSFPVGDGGDGTASLLFAHTGGSAVRVEVRDPVGKPVKAEFFISDSKSSAIIEMAAASGLRLLKTEERNPLQTSSYGTGQLIRAALDQGVKEIILCIGGSATVDGGCGILAALGLLFLDKQGTPLQPIPAALTDLYSIDRSGLDKRLAETRIKILCDVQNPLIGPNGAATIFGPQKGADADAVQQLERMLQGFASIIASVTGKSIETLKGGGAAGGIAAGLYSVLNAELHSGIDYFLSVTGFESALQEADHLITAEGNIDSQTLEGKGPAGVAIRAKQQQIPVTGFSGMPATSGNFQNLFDEIICINPPDISLEEAMRSTYRYLVHAAKDWGNRMAAR
ncbi:MAG TPA: glycerate kinase [Sediminibacterium sp.]|nr:glycerate kinase [Sediminibacterium sp.]